MQSHRNQNRSATLTAEPAAIAAPMSAFATPHPLYAAPRRRRFLHPARNR